MVVSGECRDIEQEPHGPWYDRQVRWLQAVAFGYRTNKQPNIGKPGGGPTQCKGSRGHSGDAQLH